MERQAFNDSNDRDPIGTLINNLGNIFHGERPQPPQAVDQVPPNSLPPVEIGQPVSLHPHKDHVKHAPAAQDSESAAAPADRPAKAAPEQKADDAAKSAAVQRPDFGDGSNGTHGVIVVDKTHHKTHMLNLKDGKIEDVLTVPDATGRGPKMTPEGLFHITQKIMDPSWTPPPSMKGAHKVEAGPHNPLGPRALRTDADNGLILLHGTNMPESVGKNASHGCIRHNNEDIKKLYDVAHKGDEVYITRDYESVLAKLRPSEFK